jgi:hypothetical protein
MFILSYFCAIFGSAVPNEEHFHALMVQIDNADGAKILLKEATASHQ